MESNHIPIRSGGRYTSRPTSGSFRHAIGLRVAACTLGATVGLATVASVAAANDRVTSYESCVQSLGEMPDAVNQHIDPCRSVDSAIAARQ